MPDDPKVLARLQRLAERVKKANAAAASARADLYAAVEQARADGTSRVGIARALGISRQRVQTIVKTLEEKALEEKRKGPGG